MTETQKPFKLKMTHTPTCIGTSEFELQPVASDDVEQNNNMDSQGNDTEDISQLAYIILPDNEESNDAQDTEFIELQKNEDLRETSSQHLNIELSRNEEKKKTNKARRRPLIEDNEANGGKKRKMSHTTKTNSIDQLIVSDAGGNLNNYRPVKRRKPQYPTKVKHLPDGTVVRFLHEPKLYLNQEEKTMTDKEMKLIPTEEIHTAQNSFSATHGSSSSDYASRSLSSHGPNQKKNIPGFVDPDIQDNLNVRASNNQIPQRTRNSKCAIRPLNHNQRILLNSDTNTREEQEVPGIEAPDISESSSKLQEGVLNMRPQCGNIPSHINLEPQIDLDSPSGGIPMSRTQFNEQTRLCPIPHALCVMHQPHAHFQFCDGHNLWHTYELRGGPDFNRTTQEQQSGDEEPEVSMNSDNESQHSPALITNQTQQRILNDQQQQQSQGQRNDVMQSESVYMDNIEHISKHSACDDQPQPRPSNVQEKHQQNPVNRNLESQKRVLHVEQQSHGIRLSESQDANNASLHIPKDPFHNNQPQQRGFNVQQRQPQCRCNLPPVSTYIGNGQHIPLIAVCDGQSQPRPLHDPQITVNRQSGLQNAFLNSQSQQRVLNVKKQQPQSCGNVQLESGYVANTQPIQEQPQPGLSIVQQRVTEIPAHTEPKLRNANNEFLHVPKALRRNLPQQRMLNVQQHHPQSRGNGQSESSNKANNQLIHVQPHPQLSSVQQQVTEIPIHNKLKSFDANNESLHGPTEALHSNLPQQRMLNVQQQHSQSRGNEQSESGFPVNKQLLSTLSTRDRQLHPQPLKVQEQHRRILVNRQTEPEFANNAILHAAANDFHSNPPQQQILKVQHQEPQSRGLLKSEYDCTVNSQRVSTLAERDRQQRALNVQHGQILVNRQLESQYANEESLHATRDALRSNQPRQQVVNDQQQQPQSRLPLQPECTLIDNVSTHFPTCAVHGNQRQQQVITLTHEGSDNHNKVQRALSSLHSLLYLNVGTSDFGQIMSAVMTWFLHFERLRTFHENRMAQQQQRRESTNVENQPSNASNEVQTVRKVHQATQTTQTTYPRHVQDLRNNLQSESNSVPNDQSIQVRLESDNGEKTQPRLINVQPPVTKDHPRLPILNPHQVQQPKLNYPISSHLNSTYILNSRSTQIPKEPINLVCHSRNPVRPPINKERCQVDPVGHISMSIAQPPINIQSRPPTPSRDDVNIKLQASVAQIINIQQSSVYIPTQDENYQGQGRNVENRNSSEVNVQPLTSSRDDVNMGPRTSVAQSINTRQYSADILPQVENRQGQRRDIEIRNSSEVNVQPLTSSRDDVNMGPRTSVAQSINTRQYSADILPQVENRQGQGRDIEIRNSSEVNVQPLTSSRDDVNMGPRTSVAQSINTRQYSADILPQVENRQGQGRDIEIRNLSEVNDQPLTSSRDDVNMGPRTSVAQSINTRQYSADILPQVENRQGQGRDIEIRNSSEVNVQPLTSSRDDVNIGPRASVAHSIKSPQSSVDILPQVENRQGHGRNIKIRNSSEVNVQPSIPSRGNINIEPRASVAQRINTQQRHVAFVPLRRKQRRKRERLYSSD